MTNEIVVGGGSLIGVGAERLLLLLEECPDALLGISP
jgi:hypothetical protein